jgi:predicted RNA-binding protein with PIN domain
VRGTLEVRYAAHADTVLERLAAENRERARVLLVTSDATLAAAAGVGVAKLSSQTFLRDFEAAEHRDSRPEGLAGKLDAETRARLERLRRGE